MPAITDAGAPPVSFSKPVPRKRKPAKPRGQMAPFSLEALNLIRATLKAKGAVRDLALLNLAVDSMLRAGDLITLKVGDLLDPFHNAIRPTVKVVQRKVGKVVAINLSARTCADLLALIRTEGKYAGDDLFTPAGQPHGRHISKVRLRKIVKVWAKIAHLNPDSFSGHSLRRTKAVHLYRVTGNVAAVARLLGHSNLANTLAYLGVAEAEAGELAHRFDI